MFDSVLTLLNNVDDTSVSDAHTCTPEQVNQLLGNSNNYLKTFCQNIRSINYCNFLSLQAFLNRLSFDCEVLALTECWLPCLRNHQIPEIDSYTSHKTTKHINQSDGVVVFTKSFLNPTVEEPDFNNSASGLLIKTNIDTAVLCVYRSPSTDNIDGFLSALNEILPTLREFKSVVFTGDINIDIGSPLDTRSQNYLNCLAFHGILPAHALPTRGNNCLDHTFMRTNCSATTLIFESTITDHYSSLACIKTKKVRTRDSYTVTKINIESLDKSIQQMDFTPILSIKDANAATDKLVNSVSKAILENSTTSIQPARKRLLKPWITPGLLRCIRNRDTLHKRLKVSPNNEILHMTYKRYRNFCTKLLKKAKRQYDSDQLKNAGKNSKALWTVIKNITYSTKSKHSSTQLLLNSHSPIDSCNKVNDFFVSIGKELADRITEILFNHYKRPRHRLLPACLPLSSKKPTMMRS